MSLSEEAAIRDSVSFRSTKIPPYLCRVYSYIVDDIIPESLPGIGTHILYFVYGGRADAVYNPNHPLTSDWDIIFNDREDRDLIPRFATGICDFIQDRVNSKFPNVQIRITVENKDYNPGRAGGSGRYTIGLVDPYTLYDKSYDCMDIAGCHEVGSELYRNYCDLFDTRQLVENIYYASPEFTVSETTKVLRGERRTKLERDRADLTDAIKDVNDITRRVDNDEELTMEDVGVLESFQDIIDKYLSSFEKFERTNKRRR